MGFIMDDQNYVNQQNEGSGNGQSGNYYQDYTASTQHPFSTLEGCKKPAFPINTGIAGFLKAQKCCM